MVKDFIRPEVQGIKEYLPGKTPTEPGVIKLASNENPFGPSPKALEAIAAEARKLQTYPDQKSTLLREAIAKKFELSDRSVICGNGSDDIMQILASTYLNPGDEVIISKNTFSLYELVTRIFGGKLVLVNLKGHEISLDNIASAITKKTKIIFLTNPNNPTGTIFKGPEFSFFMKNISDRILVVVDEAYAEFAEDPEFPQTIKQINDGKSLIVLRTFSKYYGLAGLRVGYGIAKEELISPMLKTKLPFNVNRLAQVAAVAALDDKEFLDKTYRNNIEGKKYLYAALDNLGLTYKKTEANFIFVEVKQPADEVFLELMKKGVIVRPLTSFGFPQAIRVSIGTREQNKKFVASFVLPP